MPDVGSLSKQSGRVIIWTDQCTFLAAVPVRPTACRKVASERSVQHKSWIFLRKNICNALGSGLCKNSFPPAHIMENIRSKLQFVFGLVVDRHVFFDKINRLLFAAGSCGLLRIETADFLNDAGVSVTDYL